MFPSEVQFAERLQPSRAGRSLWTELRQQFPEYHRPVRAEMFIERAVDFGEARALDVGRPGPGKFEFQPRPK
ncbi:MAG TPA: hypothetical protein VKO16_14555, partial [Polyangia bacterium]|nr:hypothetical protein [Polyangia bacterium]